MFLQPDQALKELIQRHFHEQVELIACLDSLYLIEQRQSDKKIFAAKPHDIIQVTHSFILANEIQAYTCHLPLQIVNDTSNAYDLRCFHFATNDFKQAKLSSAIELLFEDFQIFIFKERLEKNLNTKDTKGAFPKRKL